MENMGRINKSEIKLTIFSKSKLTKSKVDSITKELVWRYDLCADLSDFNQKFINDTFLGKVLKKWRGMRVSSANSLYELLIIGIVLQNATVRRSVQMLDALLEKYGKLLEFDNKKHYSLLLP